MSFAGIDTNFILPPRLYTSTEIFKEKLERIFYSRWIYITCSVANLTGYAHNKRKS
jgi:phenylpropionate dioxygenase-like ring-hydroxylating dioxygenase large terminal subunit